MQDEKVISTTEARQGSKRNGNLRVLIMSGILIAVVSLLLYAGYVAFGIPSR